MEIRGVGQGACGASGAAGIGDLDKCHPPSSFTSILFTYELDVAPTPPTTPSCAPLSLGDTERKHDIALYFKLIREYFFF